MDCDELDRVVAEWSKDEKEDVEPAWMAYQQSDRIREVAWACARDYPGDLIEIGCHHGGTTRELAKVAKEYGRRVVAVDPWGDAPSIYDKFLERTGKYSDVIDVIRLPSQDAEAVKQIQARPLCFAFVDGLHEYEALACDIQTVAHCLGAIAVDDVNWRPDDLRKAFWEGAEALNRALYWRPKCREGYILPKGE